MQKCLKMDKFYMEKEMATHSNVLACRIPGTEEPGGFSSMGSHRVRHDSAAAAGPHWIQRAQSTMREE